MLTAGGGSATRLAAAAAPDAAAPDAAAPDAAVALEWSAPPGCPDSEQMQARLTAALGDGAAGLRVEAVVVPGPTGEFRAAVELRGPWGDTTRNLDSPTCETLADAVVLLAQVSVQEGAAVPEPAPDPEPEPEPEPQSTVEDTASSQAESEPSVSTAPAEPAPDSGRALDRADRVGESTTSVLQGLVRVEARAGGPVLPGVDAGAAVALGLAHRWFRIEVLGAGWLRRSQALVADATLDLRLVSGQLRGCAVLPLAAVPWLRPMPCVGFELGGLRGQGSGVGLVEGRTTWRPWLAATVSPSVAIYPWRRFGFVAGATLVVPVSRPRFALGGIDVVYQVPAVAGRGFLGVEVSFP